MKVDTYHGSMMQRLVSISEEALKNQITPLEYRNEIVRVLTEMDDHVLLDVAELIVYR